MNIYDDFSEFEGMLEGSEVMVGAMATLAIVAVLVILIALVIGLVFYIFQSVGLYTAAKRRGIKNPWLAWLPIGDYWIAGSLSDQYRYVTRGEVKHRRVIILVLALVASGLSAAYQSLLGNSLEVYLDYILSEGMVQYPSDIAGTVGVPAVIGALLSMIQSGVSIAVFVFWQMSLYDYYRSSNPDCAVLFSVLGILFGFLVPFFIFACRKREDGMPPRRVEPQPEPVWRPDEPVREPWDQN